MHVSYGICFNKLLYFVQSFEWLWRMCKIEAFRLSHQYSVFVLCLTVITTTISIGRLLHKTTGNATTLRVTLRDICRPPWSTYVYVNLHHWQKVHIQQMCHLYDHIMCLKVFKLVVILNVFMKQCYQLLARWFVQSEKASIRFIIIPDFKN